jgi:hypothetical protein
MLTLEEKIARSEHFAKLCEQAGMSEWQEECEQLAAWLRELQERRKADSCEGCMYEGCDCLLCVTCRRICKDKYKPERRTDGT